MDKLTDWSETISILDVILEPIAKRPVDMSDPDWAAKLRDGPRPLDEAGVRSETETLLAKVIEGYSQGDDDLRDAIRTIFAKNNNFTWAATLPFTPTTPEGFHAHLILFSINDQGRDSRDAILLLQDLCKKARSAGVEIAPMLKSVARISSDQEKYGMGSTCALLNRDNH